MYEEEFHRCLIQADVVGMMRVWKETSPHLTQLTEADTLLALHMARVEAKSIPIRLKRYSIKLLEEHGIERHRGKWSKGPSKKSIISESVGIGSMSLGPRTQWNDSIVSIMTEGLYKAKGKGIVDPIDQRKFMLDARHKFKFRHNR